MVQIKVNSEFKNIAALRLKGVEMLQEAGESAVDITRHGAISPDSADPLKLSIANLLSDKYVKC